VNDSALHLVDVDAEELARVPVEPLGDVPQKDARDLFVEVLERVDERLALGPIDALMIDGFHDEAG